MARPRTEETSDSPATERDSAPVTVTHSTPMPPVMRVERSGARAEPYSRRYPQVRGGVCEFCGIIDPNIPSQEQYKYCPHFRGMQLMCSYCPETKNPEEVVRQEALNVAEHPYQPGMLVVWCGSYECSEAHLKRFKLNRV